MVRPADGGSGPDLIWPFPTKDLGAAPGQVALGGPVAAGEKYKGQNARVDQGWDLQDYANWDNPGDVYAVAGGTIHFYGDPNKPNVAFGPKYPVVTLDIDPATWATPPPQPFSKAIYYGHTIGVNFKDGDHVVQGDVIATLGQGPQGDANSPSQAIPLYGWLEIGWDNGSGDPIGPLSNTSPATAAGASMKAVLQGAPTKSGTGGGTGGTGTGSGDGGNNNKKDGSTTPSTVTVQPAWYDDAKGGADDPRDNLPFSAFFLGQQIVGGPVDALSPTAGRAGSLTVQFRGGKGTSKPGVTLVRGGIGQLQPVGAAPRKKGPFRCFFMMNPSTIAASASVDTSGVSTPTSQSAALQEAATYPLQNQSYTFTIMFNRMYEVWHGNMLGPDGKSGPSTLGVRWDVRALERLMGQYDAYQMPGMKSSPFTGESNYGAGDFPPQALSVQVVFGGPNSIQFQGVITTLDVTYTMFSQDMIPVEASVDVGIMRLYLPQMSGTNLMNILSHGGNFRQIGKPVTGLNPNATFNTYLGP